MTRKIEGKFVKEFVNGMARKGQYRGMGFIEISENGINICGNHVHRPLQRFLFLLFVGGLTVAFTLFISAATLIPGFLFWWLLSYLVEYVWLEDGDKVVTFDRIEAYNVLRKENLIAIQFHGKSWTTPVVMETQDWEIIYGLLSIYVPKARINNPRTNRKKTWFF